MACFTLTRRPGLTPVALRKTVDAMRNVVISLVWVGLAVLIAGCDKPRALGPPKAVAVREDGALELQAVTFNVRYETRDDQGSRSWTARIPHVVRAIRDLAPDVLGIQEALHGQAADLWVSLPDYDFTGNGRDDGRRKGEYAGIFYLRDRFWADSADTGTFWLSAEPERPGSMTWGNGIPRACTWARLVDRASGRGFYVFNTHWDHRHQGSREEAARLIAQRIDSRRKPGEPVILMGDFNAVETNPAVAYLMGGRVPLAGAEVQWDSSLLETYQAIHPNTNDRRTLHLWSGSNAGPVKIDHILVSRGARVIAAAVQQNREPMVSDHHAVSARIAFGPAVEK